MRRKIVKHVPAKRTYSRKKREQKVKFRKRYAASLFQKSMKKAVTLTKVGVLGFAVAGGGLGVAHLWNNSELLKVKDVVFEGESPAGLSTLLNIEEGQNIFSLKAGSLEREALGRFPELKEIDISRSLSRKVVVESVLRSPLAVYGPKGTSWAVDRDGKVFPVTFGRLSDPESSPVVSSPYNLESAGLFLDNVFNSHRWFYDDLKTLKTDRMAKTDLVFEDGTTLEWGVIHPEETKIKVEKWKTVREKFTAGAGAKARFVDPSRIVLNSKWN